MHCWWFRYTHGSQRKSWPAENEWHLSKFRPHSTCVLPYSLIRSHSWSDSDQKLRWSWTLLSKPRIFHFWPLLHKYYSQFTKIRCFQNDYRIQKVVVNGCNIFQGWSGICMCWAIKNWPPRYSGWTLQHWATTLESAWTNMHLPSLSLSLSSLAWLIYFILYLEVVVCYMGLFRNSFFTCLPHHSNYCNTKLSGISYSSKQYSSTDARLRLQSTNRWR